MSATEPLCYLVGIQPASLSKEEKFIIELELFLLICEALKQEYQSKYQNYFRLLKCDKEMGCGMMEMQYVRCIINDILSTEEYTLSGIACYTETPEDIVFELATGINTNPSAVFLRKLIELHRFIRRELYAVIIEKITAEYLKNK